MVSQLSLDVLDTKSLKTFRVADSSWYNKKIKIECATLEITPPGVADAVIFNVTKNFSTVFNSSNLKLKRARVYSDLQPLPDGIYKIKYSIRPNEDLWVEYDYMRNDSLLHSYYEEMCKIKLQACPATKEQTKVLKDLNEIKTYIDQSKIEVEFCGNRKRGVELYDYANKLIGRYKREGCLTCK